MAHTIGISPKPGLSRLRQIETVRIGGDSEMCLIFCVPLNATFNQEEHAPRFQALDQLSDSLREVFYLERMYFSVQIVFEEVWQNNSKELKRKVLGTRKRCRLTPAQTDRM